MKIIAGAEECSCSVEAEEEEKSSGQQQQRRQLGADAGLEFLFTNAGQCEDISVWTQGKSVPTEGFLLYALETTAFITTPRFSTPHYCL